jgi:nucleoside-diphosphate-sugar epimerase
LPDSAVAGDSCTSRNARHAPARAGDVRHSLASIERARELLGYRPNVSWQDGLERTVAWYRKQHALART